MKAEAYHQMSQPVKRHRVVVIDDFFSEEALRQLRDFLLESTIWTDVKRGRDDAKSPGVQLEERKAWIDRSSFVHEAL